MLNMEQNFANGPFQLVETPAKTRDSRGNAFVYIATDMAIVHNILIRSLNAIYLQVDSVAARAQRPEAEQDVRDFLTYCQCWCDTIKHHHHAEEEIYFPAIEAFADQKGVMDENVDGHLAFSAGLEEFTRYVYNAEANLDLFGAGEVKRLIDGFAPAFMAHMHDEIPTLLGLKKYGSEDAARAMQQACEARIVGSLDKNRSMPLIFKGHDNTFENSIHQWPQVPFFVPYLVHYVYSRKYQGAWRFAPCSTFGEPLSLSI